MPKIKNTLPFGEMLKLIKGNGLMNKDLARILEKSPNTITGLMREPARITLGDIALLMKRGHIPKEEIIEAISKSI